MKSIQFAPAELDPVEPRRAGPLRGLGEARDDVTDLGHVSFRQGKPFIGSDPSVAPNALS